MYTYIKGIFVETLPIGVILDVQGIGYRILLSFKDLGKLPAIGEELLLHTSFIVRELSQTLYGFLLKAERDVFDSLITVTGIGPKTGLAIIGHLSLGQLKEAVESHNAACLAKVPGIGKITAERLLIELQGHFKSKIFPKEIGMTNQLNDALQALMQLGYTQVAAEKAVKRAANNLKSDSDLSTLISAALKYR
ncbi:MAG: Holliday junction branch migration protein RuvA [Chlamydiales bacterium]